MFKVSQCSTDLVYDQSISCLLVSSKILEIQLPKLDSSRHCTLHFMHYIYNFAPKTYSPGVMPLCTRTQNKRRRERKWPIKDGLSRFFRSSTKLQTQDMALNRAENECTLCEFSHFGTFYLSNFRYLFYNIRKIFVKFGLKFRKRQLANV